MTTTTVITSRKWPEPAALLRLIKPITWFPPMWAYLCGAVSTGISPLSSPFLLMLGLMLTGPIVCGMSQAANDWCDRHVDAINEPDRPIPSGRVPGRWGLWVAHSMSLLALFVGWQLGPIGFAATLLAVAAAWVYSAEPTRLKRSGWWGPGLVGLSYETLPWITGAAVLAGNVDGRILLVALAYGVGAHGIMTFNDFKSLDGDRVTGIASLPVTLGPATAARVACAIMLAPQIIVAAALFVWGQSVHASIILGLITLQVLAMGRLLRDPRRYAPWFNGTGVLLSVAGMMVAALALAEL